MSEPVETAELLAFARTVEARSLSRAAAELGVPRATVSRRLGRLEERLGTRLLRRTTRSLALTDAGEALLRHARIVLDAVEHAEASVRRTDDAVRGDLRVSVPIGLPPSFSTLVTDFVARYPDVRVTVDSSSRRVDLGRDGYDVAVRAGIDLEPGLIARRLAADHVIAVASSAYVAAHGTPRRTRDLAHHRLLVGFERGTMPASYWPTARQGRVHVTPYLASNDLRVLVEAVRKGLGIAFLPVSHLRAVIGDDPRDLVQILPGVLETEAQVAVVYAEREFVPPQVRAFVDEIVRWAPTALDQSLGEKCREAGKRKLKQARA